MAITTKNRTELKKYFVKNAIPTEGNFAELMDAHINQADDGIFKPAGEALSVVSVGAQQQVLRLYANYPAANPDWLISLSPPDPANPGANRSGFGVVDGAGNTRLRIDAQGALLGGDLAVGGDVSIAGKHALRGSDNWLRLNQNLDFTGVHTPGNFVPDRLNVGGLNGYGDPGRGNAWIAGTLAVVGGTTLTQLAVEGDVSIGAKHALRGNDSWLRLNQDGAFTDGVYTPRFLFVGGNLRADGDIQLSGKHALRGNDSWLRLNQDGAFTDGVYTPRFLFVGGNLRADGDIQLSGKHALRGNDSWLRLNQDGAFTDGVYTPRFLFVGGNLRADGDIQLSGKHALRGNDSWLRLNQDQAFISGVYTPGAFRADGNIATTGYDANSGGNFPAGWGGGVHTWDVVAEGSVGYSALLQWSSIQAKSRVREVTNALATLEQLNPAIYERGGKSQVGFIAEEVREVFAHGAEAHEDDFFAVGIQPDSLLALTVAAVQELSARIRELAVGDRDGRPAAARAATASRLPAAEAPRPDVARRVEILREGAKDSQRYVTVRFHANRDIGGQCQGVRTIRIPEAVSRDECLATEFEAWHRRIVGRRQPNES